MAGTDTGTLTAEEFALLGDRGPCELIEGEVRMMTPSGWDAGETAARIVYLLKAHVNPRKLGRVGGADSGFVLSRDPDTVRVPDASFVRAGRIERHDQGFPECAPDLAVEVVSPSDRTGDVHAKAEAWLEAGARMVWVAWPKTRTVTVHVAGRPVRTLREEDTLEAGEVIPGFPCPVAAEVFE